MKYIFSLISLFFLLGCSQTNVNTMLSTGETPPRFFEIKDKKTMEEFVFDTKKFSFKFPILEEDEIKEIGSWEGGSIRDGHTIVFFTDAHHISVSTDYETSEVTQRYRAIENNDLEYIKNIREKYRYKKETKMYYGSFGKEDYKCMVYESVDKFERFKASYGCYKLNPTRTKSRNVSVVLTYAKPLDPDMAKKYTYEGLKEKAKRTLDSLYIKDEWDD